MKLTQIGKPGEENQLEQLVVPVGKISPAMITEILDKHAIAELPSVQSKAKRLRELYDAQINLVKDIIKIDSITEESETLVKLLNGIDITAVLDAEDEYKRLSAHVAACGDGQIKAQQFESGLHTLSRIAEETCGSCFVVEVATGTAFSKFRHVDDEDFFSLCEKIWEVNARFLEITFPGLLRARKVKEPPPSGE